MRDLPQVDVAWELGLHHEQGKWKGHGHIINIDGPKFYDFAPEQQKGGSGAIDLVMHVNNCNLRQAVVWLHERLGEAGAIGAAIAHARKAAIEIIQVPNVQVAFNSDDAGNAVARALIELLPYCKPKSAKLAIGISC